MPGVGDDEKEIASKHEFDFTQVSSRRAARCRPRRTSASCRCSTRTSMSRTCRWARTRHAPKNAGTNVEALGGNLRQSRTRRGGYAGCDHHRVRAQADEIYGMSFAALIHGANGITWFHYAVQIDREHGRRYTRQPAGDFLLPRSGGICSLRRLLVSKLCRTFPCIGLPGAKIRFCNGMAAAYFDSLLKMCVNDLTLCLARLKSCVWTGDE